MSEYSTARFLPARDAAGPVTCAACGCRLVAATGREDGGWRHFPSLMAGQDARGCRPQCVDALHDWDGRVLMATEAGRGPAANDAAAA
jgi:hypothetical protein